MKDLFSSILFVAIFLATLFFIVSGAIAQPVKETINTDYLLKNYTDKYHLSSDDDGLSAIRALEANSMPNRYVYETATVRALSHLFWAVSLYDFKDDFAIDEFMRINECSIYKNFRPDELEWRKIRNATRSFLKNNNADFPTRFEFIIPLKLGDYDETNQSFLLQDDYKIHSLRRFEFYATDYKGAICSQDHNPMRGYPRTLVLEFSRPFSLSYIPTKKKTAFEYIKRKSSYMRTLDYRLQTQRKMYNIRDVYLALKVKVFAHGDFLGLTDRKVPSVQMMGVLEGYEVYEDRGKENLFFRQSYVSNEQKEDLKETLKGQYELLRAKHDADGILY